MRRPTRISHEQYVHVYALGTCTDFLMRQYGDRYNTVNARAALDIHHLTSRLLCGILGLIRCTENPQLQGDLNLRVSMARNYRSLDLARPCQDSAPSEPQFAQFFVWLTTSPRLNRPAN